MGPAMPMRLRMMQSQAVHVQLGIALSTACFIA